MGMGATTGERWSSSSSPRQAARAVFSARAVDAEEEDAGSTEEE
jgi:hypothetical protein